MLIMQPALTSFDNTYRKCHIFHTLIIFLELKMFSSHGVMSSSSPHTKMLRKHPLQSIYRRHRVLVTLLAICWQSLFCCQATTFIWPPSFSIFANNSCFSFQNIFRGSKLSQVKYCIRMA